MDDETLERLAREEILNEAKLGAARADVIGPQGWEKCPLPPTNKIFLQNTLLNAVVANKNQSKHSKNDNKRKLSEDEKKKEKRSYKEKKKRTDLNEKSRKSL